MRNTATFVGGSVSGSVSGGVSGGVGRSVSGSVSVSGGPVIPSPPPVTVTRPRQETQLTQLLENRSLLLGDEEQ